MKVWGSIIFIAIFSCVGFTQPTKPKPQSPQQTQSPDDKEETLKIDSTLVTIPVSVIDPEGKYRLNLSQKDFRLFEENKLQEITNFASVEVPVNVVLMIDTSRSTKFKIEDIQRAAISFIDQLRPSDRLMVVSFDERSHVQCEFTSDRNTLKQAVATTKTGSGTKLYEAINFVMSKKLAAIRGRKAIVLFTDGVDTASKYGAGKQSMFDVEENEVIVYSIQYDTMEDVEAMMNGNKQPPKLYSSQPSILDFQLATRYLRGLATRSGGRVHQAETLTNVDEAFALIAEELRHQYTLGYYPTQEGKVGDFRRVRVEVMQPHRSIRARDGYRVGK